MRRFSPNILAAAGLGSLFVMLMVLARYLHLSTTVRFAMLAVVLLIAIVFLMVKLVRANRNAKGIEKAMFAQSSKQQATARPDRQGEIRQLQEQFDRALKTLKESKLTRGGRGSSALYALPWYLFVGPPAAGKTTAIQHSGLRFPLGTNKIRGVGGTRNCDWFFADSAIILDTAGRYMVEEEDAEEWASFLTTLRKHRKHQPINGVLVGMSVADLMQMSAADVDGHAEAFRQRLDELVRHLGVHFPVYLVLTKLDLLAGFVEFFGDLTRAERDQVWGATFELDERRQPAEAFAAEFDALIAGLADERIAKLGRAMKRQERQAVFAFPLEVAALRERLTQFVDQLFLPNPYQDSPLFRGFYLTSGTQEGAPIDRVISAMAEELGLPSEAPGAPQFDIETKAYFLKDLFTDIVVPDQHLVRSTNTGRSFPVVPVVVGLCLLLFAGWTFLAGRAGRADIHGAQRAATTLDGAGPRAVVRLDSLRAAVEDVRDGPGWLYNRDRIVEPADRLFLSRTRDYVDVHAKRALERRLETWLVTAPAGVTGAAWQGLYEDLQAYLLLTTEATRLSGDSARANRDMVRRHMEALALGEDVPADAHPALSRVYGAFLAALAQRRVQPFTSDPSLVRRAQAALARAPAAELTYRRLLREGEARFEPLTPRAIAGDGASVFVGNPTVPGIFTKGAWDSYVQGAIGAMSGRPTGSDWVVGQVRGLQLVTDTPEDVAARLRARYFADYTEVWEAFMQSLRYGPTRSVAAAAARLSLLGDPGASPLMLVLGRAASETDFTVAPAAPAAGADPTAPPPAPTVEAGAETLMRRFAWLHALAPQHAPSGGAAPELTTVFQAMADLGAELESGGPGAGVPGYEAAVRRLRMDTAIRDRLFEMPGSRGGQVAAAAAAGAAAAAAAADLDGRWAEAYRFFRDNLAGRYPFNRTSAEDARLDDVEAFFHPQSGLIAPFLEGAAAGAFNGPANGAVARAGAIGSALFAAGPLGMTFAFEPDQPTNTGGPPVSEYSLTILGQRSVYDMGALRPTLTVNWPGRSGAELVVLTRSDELRVAVEGDWALMRMLDRATVRPVLNASREYDVSWPLQGAGYVVRAEYLLTTTASADLVRAPGSFFALRLPPRLSR